MTIREKVAYLKGLADGMDFSSVEHNKLFSAIIDTLGEMAEEIEELNENALDIGEELDALSDDLAEVEEFLLDDDYDIDDDDDFDFDFDDADYDDDDDDYEDRCDFCGKEVDYSIDINCPECNVEIELNDEDIANESVTCPACNKVIELEFEEVDTDIESENTSEAPVSEE